MNLYEMNQEYTEIMDLADPETGELSEDLVNRLDGLTDLFEDKAENIGKLIKNALGEADMIDAEIKRLTERKKSAKNTADRLKNYLKDNMIGLGKTKFTSPNSLFKFNIVKNSRPSVVWAHDIDSCPEKYLKIVKTFSASTVLADWKEGEMLSGEKGECFDIIQGNHLRL